jgi:hypothetical protein
VSCARGHTVDYDIRDDNSAEPRRQRDASIGRIASSVMLVAIGEWRER